MRMTITKIPKVKWPETTRNKLNTPKLEVKSEKLQFKGYVLAKKQEKPTNPNADHVM